MRELAVEYHAFNFISGYQLFPKTYDNSNGAWEDGFTPELSCFLYID